MSKPLSLCPGCLDHCPMFTLNEFNQVMLMCECGYQQMELPLEEYEKFLASAGYAFMPSSKFDLIIKYCVMNHIYNLINVDVILDDHGEECFAPS